MLTLVCSATPEYLNSTTIRAMKQLEQLHVSGQGLQSDDGLGPHAVASRAHEMQAGSYPPGGGAPYPPNFGPTPPGMGYGDSVHSGYHVNGSIYAESAAGLATRKRPAPGEVDGQETSQAKKPRKRRMKIVRPAGSVPESEYPIPPDARVEPDFEVIQQRSKELSAANRKAREPQVRSAWVRHDTRLLVKAVDTYKCKWSQIEREIKDGVIPFERPRDQQALRDKARLLKQDFLK